MKKIRFGFVGLGQRGSSLIDTFLMVPEVEIVALCDEYVDRVEMCAKKVEDKRKNKPHQYTDFNKLIFN